MRSRPSTARIPVVHLSATFVTDNYKIQGLESGADGYLTHPVEPLVLIATVNAFIRARRAEDSMRQSEAKFRVIFEQVQDGFSLFTREFEFLEANPAICRMLGKTREELVGHCLEGLLPPSDPSRLISISQQLDQHGIWHGTFTLLKSDAQPIEMDWRFSVHSAPGVWLAIVTDATGRIRIESEREELLASERAARAAAERANRLKDDFLATLSHELRTPLSAIVGWGQILKIGRVDQQTFTEGIEAIERNAKIQTQLIEDLLDVSRITSGKLRLDIQTVDIASTVSAAIESVTPATMAKEVEIVRVFDPDAGPVAADPSRLQQVVWNLVSNAVKFSSKGGKIFVKVQRAHSSVEITVADQGQGISPDFLPHIFERFRQEDASTTRSHGGLGLGLAIVKHLVELHGGTVQAFSPGLEQGSEFVIRLPVTAIYRPEPAATDSPAIENLAPLPHYLSAGDIKGARVLVVDDDADTRALIRRLLQDCGAEVTIASDVTQALTVMASANPQLLISDIGMPNQNGYDLIQQLRARGYDVQKLPAIALTAFARGEDRRRALTAGFQMHLEKPVDPGELVAAIASLLQKS